MILTYWAALAIAAAQFAYAALDPDSYLGECSFETGYVPDPGLMDVLPLVTLAVGLIGVTAPALVRRWRECVLLYVIGAAVMALGAAGWVAVEVIVNTRLCD